MCTRLGTLPPPDIVLCASRQSWDRALPHTHSHIQRPFPCSCPAMLCDRLDGSAWGKILLGFAYLQTKYHVNTTAQDYKWRNI